MEDRFKRSYFNLNKILENLREEGKNVKLQLFELENIEDEDCYLGNDTSFVGIVDPALEHIEGTYNIYNGCCDLYPLNDDTISRVWVYLDKMKAPINDYVYAIIPTSVIKNVNENLFISKIYGLENLSYIPNLEKTEEEMFNPAKLSECCIFHSANDDIEKVNKIVRELQNENFLVYAPVCLMQEDSLFEYEKQKYIATSVLNSCSKVVFVNSQSNEKLFEELLPVAKRRHLEIMDITI